MLNILCSASVRSFFFFFFFFFMLAADNSPGGHSVFLYLSFQVGVCGPDFRSVGHANWYLPLKRGACELKISKCGSLWAENVQRGLVTRAKIWVKIEVVEAKISKCSQKGSCELTLYFCLKWDPCELQERCEKGGLQGSVHIPIPPFYRSVPIPGNFLIL